ncbi:MAG: hypothetical protein V8Q82_09035 [Christensenellales bacterium]
MTAMVFLLVFPPRGLNFLPANPFGHKRQTARVRYPSNYITGIEAAQALKRQNFRILSDKKKKQETS